MTRRAVYRDESWMDDAFEDRNVVTVTVFAIDPGERTTRAWSWWRRLLDRPHETTTRNPHWSMVSTQFVLSEDRGDISVVMVVWHYGGDRYLVDRMPYIDGVKPRPAFPSLSASFGSRIGE